MRILLSGATGLIGRPLLDRLISRGHEVAVISRKSSPSLTAKASLGVYGWDVFESASSHEVLGNLDAVIHLAGEPIAGKRWSASQKLELAQSRIVTTKKVVNFIARLNVKPKIFISASAIGYYGDRRDESLAEDSRAGQSDFLVNLCTEWERQASKASSLVSRVVILRTGIVLAKEGGALAKMAPPFYLGIGGPLGSGAQYMSWIHLEDEISAITHCLESSTLSGPVNLTAPTPVTNRDFSRCLANVLRRPCILFVPAISLKLLLGQMASMLLASQRVYPKKLLESGFVFKYPELAPALKAIYSR